MAARKKQQTEVVEVPLHNAPVPSLIDPADPAAELRSGPRPAAVAKPVIPDSPEAVINNVLCRELNDPTGTQLEHASDPSITVLDEISKGLSHGSDISHVREDVLRIAANQPEKVNIVKALMRGVDINRLSRFVKVRDRAEHELSKAALRGDLVSTEYLAFLRFSASEINNIMSGMDVEDVVRSSGGDSAGMLNKMDHAQQAQEAEALKQYKGTTPLGRELIRKQIHRMKTKLEKAGKLKAQKPDAKSKSKKS